MRILQVVAPTSAGGLERVVEALAIGLHRRKHDVAVATLLFDRQPSHPFVEMMHSAGVDVYPIRLHPRAYLRERRELAEVIAEFSPDVVHTHGYRIDLVDRSVAARRGVATTTTMHGFNGTGGLKGAFFEWLQKRSFRRFDAVVAVSRLLHDSALRFGVPDERLHHVPNAWSGLRQPLPPARARTELGIPTDRQVVGWVGRMDPVKGGDVFLRGLSNLPHPRPLGVVIGYGQEEERLRALATELGLDNDVRFYSDIRDAARYFPAFDVYVLSSRSEGLPISVLEAMASGVPIVATRVGGVPDALDESEAWLVPSEDPEAIARAMSEALDDATNARARAGRAADRLARDYSLESFLDNYERVYQRAVQAAGQ